MVDYMNLPLSELLKAVAEDGVVDEQEVKQLRMRVFADNVVDQEEADFLFDLNDAVSNQANHPSWVDFFVEAITRHLLNDPKSPGEVDEDEAKWLIGRIEKDGKLDEVEKRLLRALKVQAKALPQDLKLKMAEWKV